MYLFGNLSIISFKKFAHLNVKKFGQYSVFFDMKYIFPFIWQRPNSRSKNIRRFAYKNVSLFSFIRALLLNFSHLMNFKQHNMHSVIKRCILPFIWQLTNSQFGKLLSSIGTKNISL